MNTEYAISFNIRSEEELRRFLELDLVLDEDKERVISAVRSEMPNWVTIGTTTTLSLFMMTDLKRFVDTGIPVAITRMKYGEGR